MSGLRANQAALSIVVRQRRQREHARLCRADADAGPDRHRQTPAPASASSASTARSTPMSSRQLRTETAGGAYADQIANVLGQLQNVYGTPGEDGTLEAAYNNFTSALQALSASSGNHAAQIVGAERRAGAGAAAQRHHQRHPDAALQCRAGHVGVGHVRPTRRCSRSRSINQKLQGLSAQDPAAATLMDQRDAAIDQLSKLMDIRVDSPTASTRPRCSPRRASSSSAACRPPR